VKLSEYSGEFFLGNIQVKGSDMDGWKVIIFLIQKVVILDEYKHGWCRDNGVCFDCFARICVLGVISVSCVGISE